VKRYSSGMYVRLAFAVAAHLEPEILLVDEVLAVGDAAFQKKCLGKMGDVAKEGRTVLFVSHNMGAIRSLCTRVILVQRGRVALDSGANDVVNKYMTGHVDGKLDHTVEVPRAENLLAWVDQVSVLCNGTRTTTMLMGDALGFEIHFRSTVQVSRPSIGFVISSVQGESILNANNSYQHSETLPMPVSQGVIRCNLGVVPLMQDRYVVSFWFGIDETSEHQHLQNVITFDVLEADIWGRGKLPTRGLSSLWWATSYEFRSAP
jgi:lipopolysaccharide transport system ATP-binding protein